MIPDWPFLSFKITGFSSTLHRTIEYICICVEATDVETFKISNEWDFFMLWKNTSNTCMFFAHNGAQCWHNYKYGQWTNNWSKKMFAEVLWNNVLCYDSRLNCVHSIVIAWWFNFVLMNIQIIWNVDSFHSTCSYFYKLSLNRYFHIKIWHVPVNKIIRMFSVHLLCRQSKNIWQSSLFDCHRISSILCHRA